MNLKTSNGEKNKGGAPLSANSIRGLLEKIGKEPEDYKGQKLARKEALLRKVYDIALKGESWAVNFIADRTEGKPKQFIDLTTKNLEIEVTLK